MSFTGIMVNTPVEAGEHICTVGSSFRIFSPLVNQNVQASSNYTFENIAKQVDIAAMANLDGVYIVLHLDANQNCALREDLSVVKQVIEYAKEKGLAIAALRFFCNLETLTDNASVQNAYVEKCKELIYELPDAPVAILFNERRDVVNVSGNTEYIISAINDIKSTGVQVGITWTRTGISEAIKSCKDVIQACDIVALNMYPIISTAENLTTFADSVIAWQLQERCITMLNGIANKIWVTETGMLPYWECLMYPAFYNRNKLTDALRDDDAVITYHYGFFENLTMRSRIAQCGMWFLEHTMTDRPLKFLAKYTYKEETES